MTRRSAPTAVAWLGYGGLLPFLITAAGAWLDTPSSQLWQQALVGYGATILSFVGALHWAFAMRSDSQKQNAVTQMYVWSVVPALAGWLALLSAQVLPQGHKIGMVILVVAFISHYLLDRRVAIQLALPGWYLPLRLQLTGVACASLLATLMTGG
jgi:putative flippase GtrA